MTPQAILLAATCGVLAAGAAAAPLLECAGPVTDKTPGWRFEASGGNGGQTFNPLEGWYPDKGGKLVSPRIAIPETGAYYKLSFAASAPERAFECVACYDADGNMVADNYDVVYPGGTNRYARVLYVQEGVKEVEIFFQSARGCSASDVRLERSSPEEAAAWCDQVYAQIRPLKVAPEGPVEIVDGGNGRSIFVWGRENRKVILWNPGPGAEIPEFGPDDWRHIVCVEPANIQRECATRILPGRRHELRMTIEAKGKGR